MTDHRTCKQQRFLGALTLFRLCLDIRRIDPQLLQGVINDGPRTVIRLGSGSGESEVDPVWRDVPQIVQQVAGRVCEFLKTRRHIPVQEYCNLHRSVKFPNQPAGRL